jgi:hypothetical protein
MHPNQQTLTRFYTAFAALDADTMASCYADDASFSDPAFTLHNRREIGGMWHMLCEATRKARSDWQLELGDIRADASTGHAQWQAHYRFSATGRLVHNLIESDFTFTPAGLIASHRDQFNFWRWTRQALGMGGWILGWAPYFKTLVRRQTRAALDKYLSQRP